MNKSKKRKTTEIDINLDLSGNQEGNSGEGGYYREVIGFGERIKEGYRLYQLLKERRGRRRGY